MLAVDDEEEKEPEELDTEFGGPTEAISAADFQRIKDAGLDNLDHALAGAATVQDLSKAELEDALRRARMELSRLKKKGDAPKISMADADLLGSDDPNTMMMGTPAADLIKDLKAVAGTNTPPAAPPLRGGAAPPAPGAPAAPPVAHQMLVSTSSQFSAPQAAPHVSQPLSAPQAAPHVSQPLPAPQPPAPAPPQPPAPYAQPGVPPPPPHAAPPQAPPPPPPQAAPPPGAPPPPPPQAAPAVAAPVAKPSGPRGKPTEQLTLGAIQPLRPQNQGAPPEAAKGDRDFFWWMVLLGVVILGACLGLLVWLAMNGGGTG